MEGSLSVPWVSGVGEIDILTSASGNFNIITLKAMATKCGLTFLAVNVNDCVTKSELVSVYGCRHSLPDGVMRATDVIGRGRRALVLLLR